MNSIQITSKAKLRPLQPYLIDMTPEDNHRIRVYDYYTIDRLSVLIVKASSDNSGVIVIGNRVGQAFPLDPGESLVLECIDPKDIIVYYNGQSTAYVSLWGFVR